MHRSLAGEAITGHNILGDFRLSELRETAAALLGHTIFNPSAAYQEGVSLFRELSAIANGQGTWKARSGDKRFSDPLWENNDYYNKMLQAYMAWAQSLQNYAAAAGFEGKAAGRAKFVLGQVSDALAPTNFLTGNPVALKEAWDSGGKSLIDGYRNFVGDAAARRPVPSQVDKRPFKVGENLAATPGNVVLRTEMFELLQYKAQTERVRERPILVVPSIINKYYAFDLAPGRSLFEYLVQQGFTLFTMVFRNPQKEHDHWGMAAYMNAIDTALEAVREIGEIEDPHLWVVCGSGPLVVSLAGSYAARNDRKIGSLTLFVAPLDMAGLAETDGLGDFNDPKISAIAERLPAKSDRITADEFTLLFAMLRPNDLIWNYWVNNYLMGKEPPAFDILAWNADGTGMTAQFNRDFRSFSEKNPLVTPGAMTVKGEPIADISNLDLDSYVIGARTDHICPWPTVYRSAQMLGDRCQFVLGGSGHIQTIVSPPGSAKATYFLNPDKTGSAAEWLEQARKVEGTWWEHFVAWCHERSGPFVSAPATASNARYSPLGAAPGTYVLEAAT
ncbi:MAG TPA: alpha/beta fold hydrolase [Novosphingobium sp.]|nr:alpha/beta fold hydrolase [Novosphingobium sp.]